jgi:hypothetical protein
MNIIQDDITRMALLPPHCPMNPVGYSSFFNDTNELKPVVPYKLVTEQHKRNGHPIQRLEYNHFYSDWKKDALTWEPRMQYADTKGDKVEKDENNVVEKCVLEYNDKLKIFQETRNHTPFAVPLPVNGSNQIDILFNDKYNYKTFNYNRYASQPMNVKNRYYNPLYIEDISKETQDLKGTWMDSIIDNGMALYSSVFEDMTILTREDNKDNDNFDFIKKAY